MRLEKIEATASRDRVKLCFDDGTCFRVPVSVVADLGLSAGMELTEEDLTRIQECAGQASAKLRAVRIIAASGVSERELRRRLVQKGEREEDAKEAVQWLTNLKLLDDRQTAESIVRSGAAKGYGATRIRQMLYEKRIPRELWDEALEQMPVQDEAIDAFLQRRFRGKTPDRAECKRATDALLRRGHRWSDIRRALERYAPDEEFFED